MKKQALIDDKLFRNLASVEDEAPPARALPRPLSPQFCRVLTGQSRGQY